MTMQTANALVALGGDSGNTVPLYGLTVAEIAVLRLIHGNEGVNDIEPVGTVERTHRAERTRLIEKYGKADETGNFKAPAVEALFPGVAARVFETFAEAEIDDSFFKASARVGHSAPLSEDDEVDPIGVIPVAVDKPENLFA